MKKPQPLHNKSSLVRVEVKGLTQFSRPMTAVMWFLEEPIQMTVM